jgi:hypothetical protein
MRPYEAANSWHGVPMKRVDWLRKVCLGFCESAQQRDNLNRWTIGAPVIGGEKLNSRATIAEATAVSATGAAALGALSIGALAIGFLVIGRLIIRELMIKRVHQLTVLEDQRPSASPDKPPAEQR